MAAAAAAGVAVASGYPPELQYMEYDEQLGPGGARFSTVSSGVPYGYDPVLPEDVLVTQGEPGEGTAKLARLSEGALSSWRVGTAFINNAATGGSLASGLNLSTRSGDLDFKSFLTQRGNHPLEGLHKAAAQGDRSRIMHLMKLQGPGSPIDAVDGNGCTPLMYAVMADSRLAVEMLLNFSAKRETVDFEGRTAVHYAAFFGKHRSLKFLIESASDWTPRDSYGRTPLHWACACSTIKCLAVLLKHAAVVLGDVNPVDSEGMTPLHCAAQYGRPKHITLLNEAGVNFSAVDLEEKTALHWTASNTDPACIQALVEACPPLLNKRDGVGCTILHLTATNGASHLVEAILRIEGLELDAKDSQERSALHYACLEGHAKTVDMLTNSGALDSCIDAHGLTALHYAVQRGHLAVLRVLARYPGLTHLPQATGGEGRTPLIMAAAAEGDSRLQALEVLLSKDSIAGSVNAVDGQGQSALHLASQANSPGCVQSLLARGADPNQLDADLQTPLFPATARGHTDCIQALVVGGANPAVLDAEGQTPLHRATLAGQTDSVRALAQTGADLNLEDGAGNCAVQVAAYGGSEEVLATLLEKGASPDTQNASGLTALHLAAMEGHSGCVALLMRYGAFPNFMDHSESRLTPLDYAGLHGHTECAVLLAQNGAVSSDSIYDMAARSIQTSYRRYRVRILRSEFSIQSRAATVISRHVRGYIQRLKYQQLLYRVWATTIIQAYTRGHLQRVRYRAQLARFRERESERQLMQDFGEMFMREKASLPPLSFVEETEEEEEEVMKEAVQQREQKLRLETAMMMREIYQEKQRRWEEFREAERQRRASKATREELDRFSSIIQQSRQRRNFAQCKFQHTRSVRSHYHAAVVIQRAFREMQARRSLEQEQQRRRVVFQAEKENKAAVVIQQAWRLYREYKLYCTLHYKAILTSPVIASGAKTHSSLLPPRRSFPLAGGLHSYQRDTSIKGNPRRKMHQTEPSGFTVFRPATRDLLLKPHSQSGPARPPSHRSTLQHFPHASPTTAARVEHLLPQLVAPGSPPRRQQAGALRGKGLTVHLPEILQTK